MFATVSRTCSRRVAQVGRARTMTTKTAKFPFAGQGEVGGHPNVLQKEKLRETFFNFKKSPEVIVLIVVVGFAASLGTYKLGVDAINPETTWTPAERGSLEARTVQRRETAVRPWSNNILHTGPFTKNREILGIKPSHPALDYKTE